ncbi:MAG: hypothetical protein K6B72_01390 [Lachnospiraceae bacterium]|nr:hypothetical protein [Lachnospiraceae bacterium]
MRRLFKGARGKLRQTGGQTFILVMTVTALATVLGIMAMSGALLSIRLYGTKRISDKNFYKLEMVEGEVKAGLTRDVTDFYFISMYNWQQADEELEDTEETADAENPEDTEDTADTEEQEETEDTADTEDAEGTGEQEDFADDEAADGEDASEVIGPDLLATTGPQAPAEWFLRNRVGIFDPSIYETSSKIQMDTRKEAGLRLMETYLSGLSSSVTAEGTRSITSEKTEILSVRVEDIRVNPDGTLILQGVHLILTNYERDARSEISCDMVIRAPAEITTVDEVVRFENWERIG